jgi:hypothetical protein
MTNDTKKMLTAAEVARKLNITGQRFRKYIHARLIKPDATVDCGTGRAMLFRPESLDEIRQLIEAQCGNVPRENHRGVYV